MSYEDTSTWRLATPNGIPFRYLGQEGNVDKDAGSVTMEYLVLASQLMAFALEMLPVPTSDTGKIIYIGGAPLPGVGPNFRCEAVKWKAHIDGKPIDPFTADPNPPAGTYGLVCSVSVEYRTTKNEDDDAFLEISGSAAGDFLNTTAAGVKWDAAGNIPASIPFSDEFGEPIPPDKRAAMAAVNKNPDIPIVIVVPQTEWTIKWSRIPWNWFRGIYIARFRQALGRVNSAVFNILFNAPAETMLFMGYDYSESYSWRAGSKGQPPINLSLKFLEKNIVDGDKVYGHNHFWKPGVGWQRLWMDKASTVTPFKSFNMNQVFFTKVQAGEKFVFV